MKPLPADPMARHNVPDARGLLDFMDRMLAHESEAVAWLRRAGPVAARLNEEARND